MKSAKVTVPETEFRIWCELCCIRIAPNEERTSDNGKVYHARCYSKVVAALSDEKRSGLRSGTTG
jgi:hypothetical protein